MKRTVTMAISLWLATGIAACQTTEGPKQRPLAEKIVGAWVADVDGMIAADEQRMKEVRGNPESRQRIAAELAKVAVTFQAGAEKGTLVMGHGDGPPITCKVKSEAKNRMTLEVPASGDEKPRTFVFVFATDDRFTTWEELEGGKQAHKHALVRKAAK